MSTLNKLKMNSTFLFSKDEMGNLSKEQREFADRQLRFIFTQQMSRATEKINRFQKVQQNLELANKLQKAKVQKSLERLNNRMTAFENKRQKKIEQNQKVAKEKEQKWIKKIQQLATKAHRERIETLETANKLRLEAEKYFSKKNSLSTPVINQQNKRSNQKLIKTKIQSRQIPQNKKFHLQKLNHMFSLENNFSQMDQMWDFDGQNFPSTYQEESTINIKIRQHQKRSQSLQNAKQTFYFKKMMEKFQKIQTSRQNKKELLKLNSHRQHKTNKSIQKSKEYNEKQQTYLQNSPNNSNKQKQQHAKTKFQLNTIQNRQNLQSLQFTKRGELLETGIKRMRKQKIKRLIKEKIKDFKTIFIRQNQ